MAGNRLRQLLENEPGLVFPGVFNPFVARQVEEAGFPGVYISGAGLSGSMAVPDDGTLGLEDFVYLGRWIVKAVDIPVICDADTGFQNMEETIEKYIQAGFAALHIEDQTFPKRCGHLAGKEIVSREAMIAKIKRACAAREKFDPEFMVIARTDARGAYNVNGDDQLQEAIYRGNLYREAGADVIFPEALQSREEFERYGKEVPGYLLANMTEFGNTPFIKASEFWKFGFNIVIFPVSLFRYLAGQTGTLLSKLKQDGSQEHCVHKMMDRKAIQKFLNYEPDQRSH